MKRYVHTLFLLQHLEKIEVYKVRVVARALCHFQDVAFEGKFSQKQVSPIGQLLLHVNQGCCMLEQSFFLCA